MTEQHAEPPHRVIAGPDVDGDGVRDLFTASIRPGVGGSKGSPTGEVVFVDAISGRDGRSIWAWWSQTLLSGTHCPARSGGGSKGATAFRRWSSTSAATRR